MNCAHCNREILNKGSCAAHEKACKKNPNRKPQIRSPHAGAQKGCTPWNKGKKLGPRNGIRKTNEEVFVENGTYGRSHLRRRLIQENLIPYDCQICGIGPEWNGAPMPLILDHINGINNDNRLENLRFVCSNCDSQLPTYKSKNIGRLVESG